MFRPTSRVTLVACHRPQKLPRKFRRNLELLPKPLQLLVENTREG
jgi:hypothetical protein